MIPAFNAASTVARTLGCLARQDFEGDYEVIVADDGSTDDTREIVGRASGVRLIECDHQGPGPARNAGVEASCAPLVAFTDADCFPDTSWLRLGTEALGDTELVQGRVVADPGASRGPFDRTVWVTAETGLYECANLFVRRDLFDRLGGFEDWLPAKVGKPLAEDAWLGWRARRSGARVRFVPDVRVAHAVFPRGPGEYVAERSRLIHFPFIVAKVPELRSTLLHRGFFMTASSASFDLAMAGMVAAVTTRRRSPLVATLPYFARVARRALPWRRRAPVVAVAEVAADARGMVALARGSVAARSMVL